MEEEKRDIIASLPYLSMHETPKVSLITFVALLVTYRLKLKNAGLISVGGQVSMIFKYLFQVWMLLNRSYVATRAATHQSLSLSFGWWEQVYVDCRITRLYYFILAIYRCSIKTSVQSFGFFTQIFLSQCPTVWGQTDNFSLVRDNGAALLEIPT